MLDVESRRKDFPALKQKINGYPLVYLDNAATTQVPEMVTEGIGHHLRTANANIHRGIHELGNRSTAAYENARIGVARFLNAVDPSEIIFTSGTTEAINMVADSLAAILDEGSEVVVTEAEHHSNFIPWQEGARHARATLRTIPVDLHGKIDPQMVARVLSPRTRLLAITHCSNVLGIPQDVKSICSVAHDLGVPVLVDGAQAVPHMEVNVQDIDCDWYCFSGHKIMGPQGIGVLYAKKERQEGMRVTRFGGGMVRQWGLEECLWEDSPGCFEAGTPNIVGAVGLALAMDYRAELGWQDIIDHETRLMGTLEDGLRTLPGVQVLGDSVRRMGCLSFTNKNIHPLDLALFLNQKGIAIRSGSLCASPLLARYGLRYAMRVSPAFYNTQAEAEFFLETCGALLRRL